MAKATASAHNLLGPKGQLPASLRKRSRRYLKALSEMDTNKVHTLGEAIHQVKTAASKTKFDSTINLVMNLGIDPKQADQLIRGSTSLPHGIGKTKTVIAFVPNESDAAAAKEAGAIEAGLDELIEKVQGGWMAFDVVIAHPATMGKVGKLGRVLGPQGKMPSPKNDTITADVAQAVKDFSGGKFDYRNDSGGNVHAPIGKASFEESKLAENAAAFIDHIRHQKPQSSKGAFIKKIVVSGTMTPGVMIDPSTGTTETV